jgi:hypothetical protein
LRKKGLTKHKKKEIVKKNKNEDEDGEIQDTSVRRMATRTSPTKETLPESDQTSPTNRRGLTRVKRRLEATALSWADEDKLEDIHHIEEGDDDVPEGEDFDLFEDIAVKPKIPWDNHLDMPQLIKGGKTKIEVLGFKSPESGAKSSTTIMGLALKHKVDLPKTRSEAEKTLIRALAIKRPLAKEPKLKDEYE